MEIRNFKLYTGINQPEEAILYYSCDYRCATCDNDIKYENGGCKTCDSDTANRVLNGDYCECKPGFIENPD